MSKEDQDKAPDAFFHLDNNFSSAYFGKVPSKVAGDPNPAYDARLISNFIDLLINPEKRDLRTDALNTIRNTKAHQFLIDLISDPNQQKHQKELVMACWECGLDFSAHLIFFSEVVKNCEYPVALEAITVIDEMYNLTDNLQREKAIEILSDTSLSPEKQVLVSDVLQKLRSAGA